MSKFTVYDRHGNVWPPGFRCSLDSEDDKRAARKDMQARSERMLCAHEHHRDSATDAAGCCAVW